MKKTKALGVCFLFIFNVKTTPLLSIDIDDDNQFSTGQIVSKFGNKLKFGTGILIDDRHVLTAAHNIYSREMKWFPHPKKVWFFPGRNGVALPIKARVLTSVMSPQYGNKNIDEEIAKNFDIAVLLLDTTLKESGIGIFALKEYRENKASPCKIRGYPFENQPDKDSAAFQHMLEGRTRTHENILRVYHDVATTPGFSGSAIILANDNNSDDDDGLCCIGIHAYSGSGTRITRENFKLIESWIDELNELYTQEISSKSKQIEYKIFSDYHHFRF